MDTVITPVMSKRYHAVRKHTEDLCKPLETEDYVVQPQTNASPPKWHLGHVTWFFESLVLKRYLKGYKEWDPKFGFIFNSYYESAGPRVLRSNRGLLSRPTVKDIYAYRKYVDDAMDKLFEVELPAEAASVIEVGLNHEQQHQELLLTDIKVILGHNPLFPVYDPGFAEKLPDNANGYTAMNNGLYDIGYQGDGFCYDNELNRHRVYLPDYQISNRLVTNGEYLEFMNSGGYKDYNLWHSDGWAWVNANQIGSPWYWHWIDGKWNEYTLNGLHPLNEKAAVRHVNYYEAFAFAQWKGQRLPTEFEWEAASDHFDWGSRWEWTESSYLPYPGFKKLLGALGEYNGKWMVGQKVLRGASMATPKGHSRKTYRNFFYPQERWQFTGIRLAK